MAGAKKGGRQEQPYNFEESFERAAVYLACTTPRFMARVGHELRPDLLLQPECRLAMEAAQAIFRERGVGPQSPQAVIQHTAFRREKGKLTDEDVRAVAGLFDIYDGKEPPRLEDIEQEAIRVLRVRLRHAIAQAAVDEHSSSEEWGNVRDLMRREENLGRGEAGIGVIATPDNIEAAMARLRGITRQPFYIDALDDALEGGVPRGTLTCFMAGAGGAKSMTMSHIVGQAASRGLQAVYATLELPSEQVIARIVANATGVPINEVLEGNSWAEIHARLAQVEWKPPVVQDFTPHVTTVEIIEEWVKNIEARTGKGVDILVVDYADKLTASGKINEKGMYEEMRIVYEKLRIFCDAVSRLGGLKLQGITASQSRGREDRGAKRLDIQHLADSSQKGRIVDQLITLNFDEEAGEMDYFTAKNRYGPGRKSSGPVPVNFACGMVAPVSRAPLIRREGKASHLRLVSSLSNDPNVKAAAEAAGKIAETAERLGADSQDAAREAFSQVLQEQPAKPTDDLPEAPF